MKKFFKEFGQFIARGNVFDMAVGLIIATAFNKIVSSLVNDIIMPLVTYGTGAKSLADLSLPLRTVGGEVTLSWAYGNFIQTIIDFLIIALSVFIMVKVVNGYRKKLKMVEELITNKELKQERKAVRKLAKEQKVAFKTLWEEHIVEKEKIKAEEKAQKELQEKLEAEKKLQENPTVEMLLKDIKVLLEDKKNKEQEKTQEVPKE